jgi:hypothetical protein
MLSYRPPAEELAEIDAIGNEAEPPTLETGSQLAEPAIQGLRFGLVSEPVAIGRIRDEVARVREGTGLFGRAGLEDNEISDACPLRVLASGPKGGGILITAAETEFHIRPDTRLGCLPLGPEG